MIHLDDLATLPRGPVGHWLDGPEVGRHDIWTPPMQLVPEREEAATMVRFRQAMDVAELLRIELDPWQQYVLLCACGVTETGRYAAFEVLLQVVRQQGKTLVLLVYEVTAILYWGARLVVHSAHEQKTAKEAFTYLETLWYDDECHLRTFVPKAPRKTNGDEGLDFRWKDPAGRTHTGRLRFMTRTGSAGRGFAGVDIVVLDEALRLKDEMLGVLVPTMLARANPQLWYVSSAPDDHEDAKALADVRTRAIEGASNLCALEWAAAEGASAYDDDQLSRANPSVGSARPDAATLEKLHIIRDGPMREHPDKFAREHMGISYISDRKSLISPATLAAIFDPSTEAVGALSVGVEMDEEGAVISVAAAGWRSDGTIHAELLAPREGGEWNAKNVVRQVASMRRKWKGAVVIAPGSATNALVPAFVTARVRLTLPADRAVAGAAVDLYQRITDEDGPTIRVRPSERLAAAVACAERRKVGDSWTWQRRGPDDITPLGALTLAVYGASVTTKGRRSSGKFAA